MNKNVRFYKRPFDMILLNKKSHQICREFLQNVETVFDKSNIAKSYQVSLIISLYCL